MKHVNDGEEKQLKSYGSRVKENNVIKDDVSEFTKDRQLTGTDCVVGFGF